MDEMKSNPWVKKAENDLHAAQVLLHSNKLLPDIVCFHCQQYAEKLLKSVLYSYDADIPRTHDLSYLLKLINEKHPLQERLFELVEIIGDYSVAVRYPFALEEPTQEDAEAAYDAALEIAKLLGVN